MIAPLPECSAVAPRFLIVDDEQPVRNVLRRYLGRRGWLVTEAPSAEVALTLLADTDGAPIDAVIVDLHLPGLSGVDLCTRIAAAHPRLARRVIVATGDAPRAATALADERLQLRVLAKPFEFHELDHAVAGMLTD